MKRMKKTLFIAVLALPLYLSVPLHPDAVPVSGITAYNASGIIYSSRGETAAGIIAIDIPEDAYIYANPKGDGIGKATEVSIEKTDYIKSWEFRYPAGEIYQAKGDPDHVNIYKKTVRIPYIFKTGSNTPGTFTFRVNLAVLMCTSEACIPADTTVEVPVRIVKRESIPVMNSMEEFLSLKKTADGDSAERSAKDGVLQNGKTGYALDGVVFSPDYPEAGVTGLLKAVFFGLIAGFVLNFMPCVLPVVSLKIMSFVMNAGERKRIIVMQGILFSAGILASFTALAVLAAFFGYKWGTLFQSSFFIIAMAAFIFSMALSLFGVYTINTPGAAGRAISKPHGIYADAFIKGGVATLLATPCSGPFLGGTLAWALTMPPVIIFLIFLSIGTGMALPYLFLAANPSLVRFVPKPGEWMNHFEKAMGFLLLFTVVYLAGILDETYRMGLLLFLVFIAAGLWQYGTFGTVDKERWKRALSIAILSVTAAAGYYLSFNYFFTEGVYSHERLVFSAERLLENRDRGIITVVEFTADWCPNCSLVEKVALEKDEVERLFARDDIEFMIADITRKNRDAESLMAGLGSKSIPLLAVFPPGEAFSRPFCLRDIYTAGDVVSAVMRAGSMNSKD